MKQTDGEFVLLFPLCFSCRQVSMRYYICQVIYAHFLNGTKGDSLGGKGGEGGSSGGSTDYGGYFGFEATAFNDLNNAPNYGGLGQKPSSDSTKSKGGGLIATTSGTGTVTPGGGSSGGGASSGNTAGGVGSNGYAALYRLSK
jgi:hypothetical protein